jgi:protein SCO1/2
MFASCLLALACGPEAQAPPQVGLLEKVGQVLPLDLQLMDEQGLPVRLRTLVDKPTILTLNYFRCAGVCTPQLNGLQETVEQVQALPGKDFQILTVSFDPRDTPEIAARKRANYLARFHRPFPPEAWRFLTGGEATTAALAEEVGFRFQRSGDGYTHPAVLILVSPKGRITRYETGTPTLPAELQLALEEASRGEVQPSVNKWLKLCYRYDPQERREVLSVTRVAAALTLLAGGGFVLILLIKGRRFNPLSKD